MANLTLELKINSASNLVNVNLITKMDVYANITIHGENIRKNQKAKTNVDRSGGSNPIWNHPVKFYVDEKSASGGHLTLVIRLISRRILGNKEIGRVNVPLLELLNSINSDGNNQGMKLMTYQVRTSSGKRSGSLTFLYRFKPDSLAIFNQVVPVEPPVNAAIYPPLPQIARQPSAPLEMPIEFPKLPQPPYILKHPFVAKSSNDPLPISYGAVMTEEADQANNHALYAPPPPSSHQKYGPYGYALPSQGYGDASPPYQHRKEIGLGIGLGAGLLGGMMMGDIVSDVANCYDF
ncbi:hypothetical protein CARUB_v10006329mg [Capsella rubella]|uniref:C2 domain-containing protein n=1 Tax=Capsella rubella TaxID=81985 RepID=R0H012_9BRAS|nr:protein SRC2 [Capsella rubella]EOA17920.1 hypothetical protein CARUB_v10006329mg [Capsella rubella]